MLATIAVSLATEKFVASICSGLIEVDARTRSKDRLCQLIEMKGRKLPRDLIAIWIYRYMSQLRRSGNWELACIVKALVKKRPDPMKLIHSNKCVPVCNRAPATGPCMQIMSR